MDTRNQANVVIGIIDKFRQLLNKIQFLLGIVAGGVFQELTKLVDDDEQQRILLAQRVVPIKKVRADVLNGILVNVQF